MTTNSEANPVLVEKRDRVLLITINRPEARNAVTQQVAVQMAAALDQLDSDDSLTVGIIAGAGGTFCAGMDLKGFLRGEKPSVPGRGFAGLTFAPPQKPLIAAVDGYALAGGMEIALACDLVVANRNAQFGIPEVKRGLVARSGGLIRLPRQIPYRIAMELALSGSFLAAERAHALGLVNQLTEGAALDQALVLANEIAKNGPLAVRVSKQVIRESRLWDDANMWELQSKLVDPVFDSVDAREGAAAFTEKRVPVWRGR